MLTRLPPVQLDLDGFYRNVRREGTPPRVFYFEHAVDDALLLQLQDRFGLADDPHPADSASGWRQRAAVHRALGHEFFRVFPGAARIDVPASNGWVVEGVGPIHSWDTFETFPWPRPEAADFSVLDYYERHLPADMRVYHTVHLWETVRDLFGFENFCYTLYDDPALVDAVIERTGKFYLAMARACCDYACYGMLYVSDDLGYKTATMLPPADLRRLILPWHKRFAELAHARGKLVFLHSCGQMYDLMDEYIDDVKIDAKHSFEDVIMPVTEAKRRYGVRLTLLGGMDVDFLARADEASIRARTRDYLDLCMPGGGYFLGTGNWVTHYIPLDNYLAMLDEGRKWG
jgi:uroporphyrinogen decarboxylase